MRNLPNITSHLNNVIGKVVNKLVENPCSIEDLAKSKAATLHYEYYNKLVSSKTNEETLTEIKRMIDCTIFGHETITYQGWTFDFVDFEINFNDCFNYAV